MKQKTILNILISLFLGGAHFIIFTTLVELFIGGSRLWLTILIGLLGGLLMFLVSNFILQLFGYLKRGSSEMDEDN